MCVQFNTKYTVLCCWMLGIQSRFSNNVNISDSFYLINTHDPATNPIHYCCVYSRENCWIIKSFDWNGKLLFCSLFDYRLQTGVVWLRLDLMRKMVQAHYGKSISKSNVIKSHFAITLMSAVICKTADCSVENFRNDWTAEKVNVGKYIKFNTDLWHILILTRHEFPRSMQQECLPVCSSLGGKQGSLLLVPADTMVETIW